MAQTLIAWNPFAFMMDPAAVIAAMERSERLAHLESRICRPLDRPLIAQGDVEAASFDGAVDSGPDQDE
jgi:hypothetical protein